MTSKINIFPILAQHFSVLQNFKTGKLSLIDVFVFYFVPVAFGFLNYHYFKFDWSLIRGDIVTFSSVLTGFMLSTLALLLVFFDNLKKQESTQEGNKTTLSLISETAMSIMYGMTIGTVLIFLGIANGIPNTMCGTTCFQLSDAFLCTFLIHFGLIFFMIVKRTFVLMSEMTQN